MAYSSITKPEDYFNTKLYTGNGSTQSITGIGFQPDWVWIKGRGAATSHQLYDAPRGVTKRLISQNDSGQDTATNGLTAFDSDGFSLGTDGSSNGSSATYVAWNWLGGTTSGIATDAESDITPTGYSFNQTSGCSIVTYTGTGTSGEGVPHGLGAKPKFYMVKRTDTTGSWQVFTQPQINTSNATKYLRLNSSDAEATNTNRWNGWQPDATNFYLGNSTEVNANGGTYVAYVFAEKQGYSRISKYTGNGNADGIYAYTGFKPAFVLVKRTDLSQGWILWDNRRPGYNLTDLSLTGNESGAEETGRTFDILSNGFKLRSADTATNASGSTYFYMAFAENPLVVNVSGGLPATAR